MQVYTDTSYAINNDILSQLEHSVSLCYENSLAHDFD